MLAEGAVGVDAIFSFYRISNLIVLKKFKYLKNVDFFVLLLKITVIICVL